MKLKTNFLLSQITTFKLGGPAKFYLAVTSAEEAVAAILIARDKKIPYCLVGGGSNLVFNDKGFFGLVIHWYLKKPKATDLKKDRDEIIVSAGVDLGQLINFVNKNNLAGMEKVAGIPGTVGGALVGNAGAYGETISDHLKWVEIFDGTKICRLQKKGCQFTYRESIFKKRNWLIVRASFCLPKGKAQELEKESREIKKIRWGKFGRSPICAGSFFKNVYLKGERFPVAKLIEQAGATNLSSGGISIASWHHNFLINDGKGTTKDLLRLASKIKKVVHRKLKIKLEEEVRFVL